MDKQIQRRVEGGVWGLIPHANTQILYICVVLLMHTPVLIAKFWEVWAIKGIVIDYSNIFNDINQ